MNGPMAPIFNICKRPRHALVSEPFDGQPSTSYHKDNTASRSAAMPDSESNRWNQRKTANPQLSLLPPKPSLPQYRTQRTTQTSSVGQRSNNHTANPTSTMATRFSTTRRSGSQQTPRGTGSSIRTDFSRYDVPADAYMLSGSVLSQKRPYEPNSLHVSRSLHGQSSAMIGTQPRSSMAQAHSYNPSPIHQSFSTQAYNRGERQSGKISPLPSTRYMDDPTTKLSKLSNISQATDRSLRVLTVTIEVMKQLSDSENTVPLIFEVFGILDSAVTSASCTSGREFLLADELNHVSCVFFEIDRDLIRLTRGQWYRCVGTYDSKLQKFKCVSVRPTSPGERNSAKLSSRLSKETMRPLVKSLREV